MTFSKVQDIKKNKKNQFKMGKHRSEIYDIIIIGQNEPGSLLNCVPTINDFEFEMNKYNTVATFFLFISDVYSKRTHYAKLTCQGKLAGKDKNLKGTSHDSTFQFSIFSTLTDIFAA